MGIHMLKEVKWDYFHCTLLGDRGYLSADYQLDLFTTAQIRLNPHAEKSARTSRVTLCVLKEQESDRGDILPAVRSVQDKGESYQIVRGM